MTFKLNALVPDADDELAVHMRSLHKRTYLTRSGTLVVPLRPNRELSHASHPEEWRDTGRQGRLRYRPDFASGTVHEMFDFPEELADTRYRLVLEEAEAHARGSYCQVVTDYKGGRLRPYYRESADRRWSDKYIHPTVSVFSAPAMGVLRLDANQADEQNTLVIHRARIVVAAGIVTVVHEQLLRLDDAKLAFCKLDTLPDGLQSWLPALMAHYERWECDEWRNCDGHYHLE